LHEEKKMKNKVSPFALATILVAGFAAPALAQNTNWKLNSERSAGRLSVSSNTEPNAAFDAGIARVKGSVRLNAGSPAHSWFDFTIYPADQSPASINEDGSLNAAEFSNVPRSTVINFRSQRVTLSGNGDLAVTGDLTLSHLERPVGIRTEDFPGLFDAVTNANWPLVLDDKSCQEPAIIGEEYHGTGCTSTSAVVSSRPSPGVTVEEYPGSDPATRRVRDNVKIALTLELTRDGSAVAEVAGN
jgi:polyisoprenoid-binding protein YceI